MKRIVLPLLLALLYGTTSTQAQVRLAHKVRDGETSTATTSVKSEQTLTIAGMAIPTSSGQKITISSENGKRGADGKIAVKQIITSLKADIDVNGQQLSFDSAKPDAPPPGTAIDVLLDVFKANSKSEWTTVLGQDNRVIAIEGREKSLESLPEELQAATKKQFEPAYLVKAANQELEIIPNKPIKKGDRWDLESTLRLEAGQSMTFKTAYRYEGVVEQDGKPLHKITLKATDVSYSMDADSPSPLKYVSSDLKIAESEGAILFDNEGGHVVSSTSKLNITGSIKFEAGGNELPAELDLTLEQNTKRS